MYTPVVNRDGDTAEFIVEVLQAGPVFNVDIEHKNRKDSSWSVAASLTTIQNNGSYATVARGLKEQVRLKVTTDVEVEGSGRVLIYSPNWQ